MDEPRRIEIERKLEELGDPSLIQKFHSILLSHGYKLPSPMTGFSVEEVYEYGRELALHKICEEIDLINVINRHSYKGGGPELGKINIFVCATSFQLRSILKMKGMDSGLDNETRTLIHVFGMAENEKLPEVDSERFK